MSSAIILQFFVFVIFVSYGAVDAWKLNYATENLCLDISDKLSNFRPFDSVLKSLAEEFGKINLCKEQHSLWFWQSIDSTEKGALIRIRNAAYSRIREIKSSEIKLILGMYATFMIFIVLKRLLTSETVRNQMGRIKEKSIAGFDNLRKWISLQGNAKADEQLSVHRNNKSSDEKRKSGGLLMIEYHPIQRQQVESENKSEILLFEYHPLQEERKMENNSFMDRVSKLQKDMATSRATLLELLEYYK
jgi:hypothetical protein